MDNKSGIRSELELGMKMGNSLNESGGIVGEVTLECFSADGELKWTDINKNLITDVGDQYYAGMAIALVQPSNTSAPTLATCMKLGTGTTAVAKNSTGSALVTYTSGTNKAFDATYPSRSTNVISYVCTFGPGVGTATLGEIVMCKTNADATSASADTIARSLISPTRVKAAGDTLVATWTHTFLGA